MPLCLSTAAASFAGFLSVFFASACVSTTTYHTVRDIRDIHLGCEETPSGSNRSPGQPVGTVLPHWGSARKCNTDPAAEQSDKLSHSDLSLGMESLRTLCPLL